MGRTWEDWDALSPEERDPIQKEVASMERPDSPWGTYQPSVYGETEIRGRRLGPSGSGSPARGAVIDVLTDE